MNMQFLGLKFELQFFFPQLPQLRLRKIGMKRPYLIQFWMVHNPGKTVKVLF